MTKHSEYTGGLADLVGPRRTAMARIASLDTLLKRRSVLGLGLFAGFLGVLKAGFSGIDPLMWSPETWPKPDGNYPHLSYGIRTIAFALGATEPSHYTAIGFSMVIVTIVLLSLVFAWAFGMKSPSGQLAVLLVLAGPPVWILAGRVGHPDAFILLGGALLGLQGHRLPWAVMGTALCVLGAPEQAVLVTLSLVVLSYVNHFREYRLGAWVSFVIAVLAWLFLNLWSLSLGQVSRTSILLELLPLSLERFFIQFPLLLYAGFGFTAVVVAWLLASVDGKSVLLLATSVLFIPLIATASTMDQGRVLVSISFATLCAILVISTASFRAFLCRYVRYPLAIFLCIIVFLPAIDVTGNTVRTPWVLYYPYIQSYLIDRV